MEPLISRQVIERVVLDAMALANRSRTADRQLEISPTAPIFGAASPLDSLGLVALLMDVEDMLRDRGVDVTLSDDRAVSRRRTPFRDVPALVAYIEQITAVAVQ